MKGTTAVHLSSETPSALQVPSLTQPQVLELNKTATITTAHFSSAEPEWSQPNVFFTFEKLRTHSTCPLLALHKSPLFSTFAVYSFFPPHSFLVVSKMFSSLKLCTSLWHSGCPPELGEAQQASLSPTSA